MTDKRSIKKEIRAFEDSFVKSEKDIIILTDGHAGGAGKSGQATLWTASTTFIAYYDCETQQLIKAKDRVEWLADESQRGTWIHDLQAESLYRLRVRQSKPAKQEEYQDLLDIGAMKKLPDLRHRFMLVEVLERQVAHEGLQQILTDYQKPVFLDDETLGRFELEKDLQFFSGTIHWMNEDTTVYLDTDENNEETADECLASLQSLVKGQQAWDQTLRSFAADQLTELANDWLEDAEEDPVTPESFASRLSISELAIHKNGHIEVYFNDDDMFWGHAVLIDGNVDGTLSTANIVG